MLEMLLLTLASLTAGFVDAIVGGGGLVLVPALFAALPQAAPATLFGTNKGASTWGTLFASVRFARRVEMRWAALLPAAGAAALGALAGAWAITLTSATYLRQALPLVLLAVLVYTLAKKELGRDHRPRYDGAQELWAMAAIGSLIGFYDGFFGPGAGSFFVFAFVRVLGYDFLNASASAKFMNLATNSAALLLLGLKGHVLWHLVPALAVANIAGSWLGTRLALQHGAGFVRVFFILIVSALIIKLGFDAFFR